MAENSAIEWTDHTFNPWEGCQKVGPGCDHCYAETRNARFAGGTAPNWGPGAPRRRTSVSNWNAPLRWQADTARFLAEHGRRQRVFCASLADVFDNAVVRSWRTDLAATIAATPDLDWLLLTKRIGNAAGMMRRDMGWEQPPANVWIGATIVNQAEANRDVPVLLATPAHRRFLSMEPLLGPVSLEEAWHGENALSSECWGDCAWCVNGHPPLFNCQRGRQGGHHTFDRSGLDWIIVGGESGRDARPLHFTWVRQLRDECHEANVPFLFKQWGEWAPICSMSEELTDSLYHPAPARSPDANRRCKVDQLVMHNDGETFALTARSRLIGTGSRHAFEGGFGAMTMFAVGKKRAGRLLDGVTHDGVPA